MCDRDCNHEKGLQHLNGKKWKHIKDELCPVCGVNTIGKPSPCAYQVEIKENTALCYCCSSCKSACAENI